MFSTLRDLYSKKERSAFYSQDASLIEQRKCSLPRVDLTQRKKGVLPTTSEPHLKKKGSAPYSELTSPKKKRECSLLGVNLTQREKVVLPNLRDLHSKVKYGDTFLREYLKYPFEGICMINM